MTKNELREIQYFLGVLADPNSLTDDMGVFEGMLSWIRQMYREQGPKKLGKEYIKL